MNRMYLTGKLGDGKYTLVSNEDVDLSSFNWSLHKSSEKYSYIKRHWRDKSRVLHEVILHRVILERKLGRPIKPRFHCHHLDEDPVGNNQRENLVELPMELHAILTYSRKGSSDYRGVVRNPKCSTYKMTFCDLKGNYKSEIVAARTWDWLLIQTYEEKYPEIDLELFLNFERSLYPKCLD